MKEVLAQLKYSWRILWHPIDGYYELQYQQKGSMFSATILITVFYICEILNKVITNFVFNLSGLRGTSPVQLFAFTIVPIFIWVLSNYLIGSITNGQGTFKSIYISSAYALLPYIFFSIPVAIISNVLTNADKTIYDFLNFVIMAWMVIMFYLEVKETHGYEIFEAMKNILWMIFTATLVVVFSAAIYGITIQSFNFLVEFFKEVIGYV